MTYVEAARLLAARLLSESETDEQRIRLAFRLATSRDPQRNEVEVLLKRLVRLREHYAANDSAAKELIDVGEMETTDLPKNDLAAYTTVCLLIMNLDEALNK